MRTINTPADQSGSVMIAVLFFALVMSGIAGAMYMRSVSSSTATSRNTTESHLLLTAESGLGVCYARLKGDAFYAVRDVAGYKLDGNEYVGADETVAIGGGKQMQFKLRLQYLAAGVPVVFANRADPKEDWDTLRVASRAGVAGLEREVAAWYELEMGPGFNAAIISDAISPGSGDSGSKGQAQLGDVVLDMPDQTYLFGGVRANGQVIGDDGVLTTQSAATEFAKFSGEVNQKLAGTGGAIPDFTGNSADQLFNFARFEAAAAAGAGKVYTTVAAFKAAVNAANALGKPLEGIIVVKIDPKDGDDLKDSDVPAGINVKGSLVFRFAPGTDPLYKIIISAAINVNAVDLSAWNPAVESTWPTGYPPVFSSGHKGPEDVDISPTYANFTANSDLPAVMFENGVVDMHGPVNVSGVVYGPSFMEIENKSAHQTQYFNGAVIGGAGIYFQGHNTGRQGIRFSQDAINDLETHQGKGKELVRKRFTILQ